MTSLTFVLVAVCVVLLFTVHKTDGLDCYSCTYCGESFNANGDGVVLSRNCKGSCESVSYNGVVTRFCYPLKEKDGCIEFEGIKSCTCNSDRCNTHSFINSDTSNTGSNTNSDTSNTGSSINLDIFNTGCNNSNKCNTGNNISMSFIVTGLLTAIGSLYCFLI